MESKKVIKNTDKTSRAPIKFRLLIKNIRGFYAVTLIFVALIFAATGCVTHKSSDFEPFSGVEYSEVAPYIRINRSTNGTIELQTAIRKFSPLKGKGAEIWLVAVTHIGETNYYRIIQGYLNARSLVLYEGVSNRPQGTRKLQENALAQPRNSRLAKKEYSTLQEIMAGSLGLAFQLDEIDYFGPNFKNCDLSIKEIETILSEKRPEPEKRSAGEAEFKKLIEISSGEGLYGILMGVVFKFIGSSPKLKALVKLGLIETLGRIDNDITQWDGLPEGMRDLITVLIHERNKAILTSLKKELIKFKKNDSIAILYGAGHMPDIERRLRDDFNYKPDGQVWLSAFSVNIFEENISWFEYQYLQKLVEVNIRNMKFYN